MPENSDPLPDNEILIQQYLDGTLDEDGRMILLATICEDKVALEHLADHYVFDSLLRDFSASELCFDEMPVLPPHLLTAELGSVFAETPYPHLAKRLTKIEDEAESRLSGNLFAWFRKKKKRRNISEKTVNRLILLPLLLLFFAVGFFSLYRAFQTSVPVAERGTFVKFQNVRWQEEPNCDFSGQKVLSNRLAILSGQLAFQLTNGVNLMLQGHSEMEILSDRAVLCRHGKIFMDVPPQPEPFQVQLPQFTVRVLGTAFVLDAGASESTIYMSKGRVVLEGLPGGPITLEKGEAVTVTATKEIRNFAVSVEPPPEFDRFMRETHDQTATREQHALRIKQDPGTVVYMNFERSSTKRGMTGKLNWVLGRSPGQWSLRFPHPDDDLFLPVRNDYRQATLIAWVRRDSLREDRNALFYNQHLRWHFANDGGLRWQPTGEAFRESMPIPGELADQWICVAVVVDTVAGTLTHYLNGREILVESIDSEPIRCNGSRLGGGVCIDEFLFAKRPYAPEEIELFYRATK